MVATTVAAVRGDPRSTGPRLASWHLLGLVVGAIALASLASASGEALRAPIRTITPLIGSACLLAGVATAAAGRSLPVLSSPAQVPKAWSTTMSAAQHSFAYGVGLGFGVLTRIPTWSLHALLALLLLSADLKVALVAAALYAAGRALPVIVAVRRRAATEAVVTAIERLRPIAFRVDGVVLTIVGVVVLIRAA